MRNLSPSRPYGLMGILNLTPDSFYDGGHHQTVTAAVAAARRLVADGADIIDLGAESSRPGASSLEPREECARLLPALHAIRTALPGVPLSLDTYHAQTAAVGLGAGVAVINDISACAYDPGLVDVLVQYRPAYVLMHSGGRPRDMQAAPCYANVRDEVRAFFAQGMDRLVRAGLPEDCIALDPGIGFGKTLQHNLELLAHPEDWLEFGRPVLLGVSMKSLFGDLCGLPVQQRGALTQVTTAMLHARGVTWHRVHDVAGANHALKLACHLCAG